MLEAILSNLKEGGYSKKELEAELKSTEISLKLSGSVSFSKECWEENPRFYLRERIEFIIQEVMISEHLSSPEFQSMSAED